MPLRIKDSSDNIIGLFLFDQNIERKDCLVREYAHGDFESEELEAVKLLQSRGEMSYELIGSSTIKVHGKQYKFSFELCIQSGFEYNGVKLCVEYTHRPELVESIIFENQQSKI